jgi:hypothetical protein
MKKRIYPEKENKEEKILTELQNENQALKEYLNLKEEVYFRQQLLLGVFRIAKALEDSLNISTATEESEEGNTMKKKKQEPEEDEEEEYDEEEEEE